MAVAQDTELVGSLVQLMHKLQDLYAESSRPLGLTPQQAHLLCVLLAGPFGMTELSRIMSIERSSLTSMVDRLERRELVERLRDPADRRACRIGLSATGTEARTSGAHGVHGSDRRTDRRASAGPAEGCGRGRRRDRRGLSRLR